MKKLWSTPRYRARISAKQKDELRRKRVATLKRRAKHATRLYIPTRRAAKRRLGRTVVVTAPMVFSLLLNTEETLRFLSDIERAASRYRIRIEMSAVVALDPEAVAAFVAIINSLPSAMIGGNEPRDPIQRQRLHDFGFYEHVKGIASRSRGMGTIRMNRGGTSVEAETVAQLLDFAAKRMTGAQKPSYTIFLEAMANTFDHASDNDAKKPWFAGVYFDESRNRVCFTLIDRGMGIMENLNFKQRLALWKGNPFKDSGEKLYRLLKGEIPSRSGVKYRGRGLPEAYESWRAGRIRNLAIVTNNAHGNAVAGMFVELNARFNGTIVYWEV